MKQIILFFFAALLLVACSNGELSKSKKAAIKYALELHNITTTSKFNQDSITEVTNFKISLVGLKFPKDTVESYIENHMAVFSNEWNKPYEFKKDRNITPEKYMDYCKGHNLDPETYYNFLD